MQKALIDVDRAIKTITNLPEGSEKPETKVIIPYEQIGLVLLSGRCTRDRTQTNCKGY